jgi:hypothetical protein
MALKELETLFYYGAQRGQAFEILQEKVRELYRQDDFACRSSFCVGGLFIS